MIGTPLLGRSDDQLMEDVKGADIVGIDAPFGWPEPFFDAIRAHRTHGAWPGRGKGLEQFRQTLRLRSTDLVVKREALLTPLSVSADKIAVTTFRCALLLDRLRAREAMADRSLRPYRACRRGLPSRRSQAVGPDQPEELQGRRRLRGAHGDRPRLGQSVGRATAVGGREGMSRDRPRTRCARLGDRRASRCTRLDTAAVVRRRARARHRGGLDSLPPPGGGPPPGRRRTRPEGAGGMASAPQESRAKRAR